MEKWPGCNVIQREETINISQQLLFWEYVRARKYLFIYVCTHNMRVSMAYTVGRQTRAINFFFPIWYCC